jgi:hypothetical protein
MSLLSKCGMHRVCVCVCVCHLSLSKKSVSQSANLFYSISTG